MPYDFSKVKLLIVEDMVPMLQLTVSLMKTMGFKEVHGAKSAEEGFRIFCQHNHELVVTDWLMEPYDGIDLIKMIRRDVTSPNKYVPIILMTGYSDKPRVETARDMGVTEFLMKPYTARDMYARIVQIIEKPRQFVDTGIFFGPDRRRRKNFDFNGSEQRGVEETNLMQDVEAGPENDIYLRELAEEARKI